MILGAILGATVMFVTVVAFKVVKVKVVKVEQPKVYPPLPEGSTISVVFVPKNTATVRGHKSGNVFVMQHDSYRVIVEGRGKKVTWIEQDPEEAKQSALASWWSHFEGIDKAKELEDKYRLVHMENA